MLAEMRLLFATDGSRGAAAAEGFLLSLPLSCADEVAIVTSPTVSDREAAALVERCRWRFAARDVQTATFIRAGSAPRVIESVALERATELAVIGSRGLGAVTGALAGSVARELTHDGVVPVLVVRGKREAPRHVLLAVDGSPDARAAVDLLARLPLPMAAPISVLQVHAEDGQCRGCEQVVEHARATLGARIEGMDIVDRGHIGEEVLRHALASGSDLIVLGTRGQTRGTGVLRLSVSDHVLSHAHCAVLIATPPLRPRFVESRARALSMPAIGGAAW